MKTCSIDRCGRPARSRGWCGMHYERWRKHRDPLFIKQQIKTVKVCSINDCSRLVRCMGWCDRHYRRWLRQGNPTFTETKQFERGEARRWLTDAVQEMDREKCWDWPFNLYGNGRGTLEGRIATHIALELDGRPRPDFPRDNALHSCDNGYCVNPSHLRWGTKKENTADLHARIDYCKHCDHCNGG